MMPTTDYAALDAELAAVIAENRAVSFKLLRDARAALRELRVVQYPAGGFSMKIAWHRFASIVKAIAPTILVSVNPALAPVASIITHAITEAEDMPGASGADKAAHVQKIVADVAPLIPGANPAAINEALQEGIDTVVAATHIVAKTDKGIEIPPPTSPTL